MTLVRIETRRGHRYKLDGERVRAVTALIGAGIPRPALVPWAARTTAEYAVDHWRALAPLVAAGQRDDVVEEIRNASARDRDQAAATGTRVHALAEALAHGEEVEVPDDLLGYVSAASDFLDDWGLTPVMTEVVVASRQHQYAGTADLVAQLPSGEVALFDYTTSRSGIWPEKALQLAAYRHAETFLDADGAERFVHGLGITAAYAVHLRPDGYSVHPVDSGRAAFRLFLDAAAVARGDKARRALVHPPVDPARVAGGPLHTVRRRRGTAPADATVGPSVAVLEPALDEAAEVAA
ncbi:hypothetical protein [Streptomyces luteireticuli]|uniref:PD-(D/E)XK nuclease family protein n=1 Tax=Streptomyces luteireticuli TaxID=173858 RepID=A0ABN0Z0I0_9ACTN